MAKVTLSSEDALMLLVEPAPDAGVQIVTLSPEAAGTFLSANTKNRNLYPPRVENMCRILRNGKWQLSPDAITIDNDGVILNGQHRLAACVETGVPIEVLLYVGAEPQVREIADTGLKRTFAQVLNMNGYSNSASIAAAVSLHYRFSHRLLQLLPGVGADLGQDRVGARERNQGNASLDHATLLQWAKDHPEVVESGRLMHGTVHHFLPTIKISSASVLRALTVVKDAEQAELFMDKVIRGEELRAGEPEYTFRNWVLRNGRAANQVRTLAVGLKMWNAKREGRSVQAVYFRTEERFPVPQ